MAFQENTFQLFMYFGIFDRHMEQFRKIERNQLLKTCTSVMECHWRSESMNESHPVLICDPNSHVEMDTSFRSDLEDIRVQ